MRARGRSTTPWPSSLRPPAAGRPARRVPSGPVIAGFSAHLGSGPNLAWLVPKSGASVRVLIATVRVWRVVFSAVVPGPFFVLVRRPVRWGCGAPLDDHPATRSLRKSGSAPGPRKGVPASPLRFDPGTPFLDQHITDVYGEARCRVVSGSERAAGSRDWRRTTTRAPTGT